MVDSDLRSKFLAYFKADAGYGLAFQDIDLSRTSVGENLRDIALRSGIHARVSDQMWKRINNGTMIDNDKREIEFNCQIVKKIERQFYGSLSEGDYLKVVAAGKNLEVKAKDFMKILKEKGIWK